ncbi:MAG: LysR family transcriptional regulator [Pseudomonadota bacterium]
MNEMLNWDDLRLFLAVARQGGLAGAAPISRASAPTLSRRMLALEQMMGVQLFTRHRSGYELTRAGDELLKMSESLERSILRIDRWRFEADPIPVVRIAAGDWTSIFIARHMSTLVEANEALTLEVVSGISPANLLRREANIGLRNSRPELPGLAGRRLVGVEFAVYGEKCLIQNQPETRDQRRYSHCRWIRFLPPGPKAPSAVWLDEQLHGEGQLGCSSTQVVLEAALAGMGLCVLPCFIGDREKNLRRASGPIPELSHEQWLVTHDDDRRSAHIKVLSQRLASLINSHKALFEGRYTGSLEPN